MHRVLFRHHPVIGYTYVPGIRARVPHESGGYLLQTNSSGFRCRYEFTEPRHRGRKRVLIAGDSFTSADGVSDSNRYSELLEDALGIETFNFALPGTGVDQQYLAWLEYGKTIDCDLLLVPVMVATIVRNLEQVHTWASDSGHLLGVPKPWFQLAPTGLVLKGVPVAREAPKGTVVEPVRPWTDALAHYERRDDPGWLVLRALLQRWVAESRVPTLVVPLPVPECVEGLADAGPVRERFRELDVPMFDPFDVLAARTPEERRALRFPVDPHPSTAGHQALADALGPAVAERLAAA